MLFENNALEDLLETLNPETKYQLRYLIKAFEEEETFGMPTLALKKWEQEQTLRKILRTAGEFFCRGQVKNYFFKNDYVEEVKTRAGGRGFNLKSKIYQRNCFNDGARRNVSTSCWILESEDGKIEFFEDENTDAVKILFFTTAAGGSFFQLKRLVTAAQELLLVEEKNLIYGSVLSKESEIYPFESKNLKIKNLTPKEDGKSRLYHLYLKLGAESLNDEFICWRRCSFSKKR